MFASDLESDPFDRSGTLPGDCDGTRTHNLSLRRRMLYPIELHNLTDKNIIRVHKETILYPLWDLNPRPQD